MYTRLWVVLILCLTSTLFGRVENSVISQLNELQITEFKGKIDALQVEAMEEVQPDISNKLRVMSFNMLFNLSWSERELAPENRWRCRKERVIEYLAWAKPDLIGSQELQPSQIRDLERALGDEYGYYGEERNNNGEIAAIFYRKERLSLVRGESYYYSETPAIESQSPHGVKNTFTVCQFHDYLTGKEFVILNSHLAFGRVNERLYEVEKLRDFVRSLRTERGVIVTGDFNTFPFRQDLDVPFYDGERVERVMESTPLLDSMRVAIYGHFGPIASSNYSSEQKRPFCGLGTPGVILDHIYISENIKVLGHAIDPARVNGYFPSDHFPVIADLLL